MIDVSFISLRKVLPGRAGAAPATEFDCLAMVKPQFEVGRERVGKGGVVRDPELRRAAVAAVAACGASLGCSVLGFAAERAAGAGGQPRDVRVARPRAGARAALADVDAALAEVARVTPRRSPP